MAQLSLPCPHCRTERIGFVPRGAVGVKPGRDLTLLFLQCEGCGHGVIAEIFGRQGEVTVWMQGGTESPGSIVEVYPKLAELETPAHIPDNVRSAFLSGLENLPRPNGANAAAMMFRRSVELSVKKLNPDGKGNLKDRIAQLSPDLATPAMKEWATHVRLEANEATHEEDYFSKEDAEELNTFAQMFLTYAFTLPEMLKRARGTSP